MPRRSLTLALAGLYAVALLFVGLWPTHIDKNVDVVGSPPVQWIIRHLDLSQLQAYNLVEVTANVALFVPLGALAMMWSEHRRWLHAVLLGLAVSGAVELMQDVFRPGRTASWVDVLANTVGTALGAALIALWRLRHPSVVPVASSHR
jgi:glycopeptide antibiotics resistance protein